MNWFSVPLSSRPMFLRCRNTTTAAPAMRKIITGRLAPVKKATMGITMQPESDATLE